MSNIFSVNQKNEVDALWVKNFYYNRSSIQKLIFLFSFLNHEDFNVSLSKRIENFDFNQSDEAKINLIEINKKFLAKASVFEYPFGFIWIFESHLIYYLKEDFDFDEFYAHFSNLESSEKIYWNSIEFFDKAIKILEIFKKSSIIRIYRDEVINQKTKKIKNIKIKKIKIDEKESYFFLKKYDSKNIKLVLYFYKI